MILQFFNLVMWRYVIQDIGETLRLLPAAVIVGAATYLFCLLLFRSNADVQKHLLLRIIFLMYLLMLVQITLLTREPGSRTDMDLRLFGTLGDTRANAYVMENLLLFIPYGTLLPLIWRRARWGSICVLIGALTSAGIEVIQLVTQRGYFQVDDIVMNTLGMLCGYMVYRIIKRG